MTPDQLTHVTATCSRSVTTQYTEGLRVRVNRESRGRFGALWRFPQPSRTLCRVASCGKPVVVLVEDDPGMRMVYSVNLRAEGYHVVEAPSREDALRAVDEHDVALMVFDGSLTRPDDGLELGQQIRKERPRIALVIVSGRATGAEERTFADATFTKPFELSEFVQTVKRLVPA